MRRILMVAVVALGACGSESSPPLTQPSGAPTAEPFRSQPVDWYLISADGTELRIGYHMGGVASDCERAGEVEVDETTDAVTVSAHKLVRTNAEACTEELMLHEQTVALDATLGDRELRGCAPTSDPVDEDALCRDRERTEQAGYTPS